MTASKKRVSFQYMNPETGVLSTKTFYARPRVKRGISHAPGHLQGYAYATKVLGKVPTKGTHEYYEWVALAKGKKRRVKRSKSSA